MRIIAVEEHFITPAFVAGPGKVTIERFRASRAGGVELVDKLSDVGAQRVAAMDAAGIDMQVLSLNSPGVEQAEPEEAVACARDANDFLAEAIRQNPEYFAGFAALPVQAPDRAADELEPGSGALFAGDVRGIRRRLAGRSLGAFANRSERARTTQPAAA